MHHPCSGLRPPPVAGKARSSALLLSLAALACACASRQRADAFEADLLLRGGPIFLADSAGTTHRALAVRLARVVALDADAEALVGPRTRVVDLRGRLATPGMNDAHCHLGAGGLGLLEVDLRGSTSLAEIERRVAEGAKSAAPGEWITGRGWDQTRLPSRELGPGGWPTKETLDRAGGDHPVYLRRVDGHTGWASSRALQIAGVDARTQDPSGGRIVRDARGEPTGILEERATELVAAKVPPPSPDKRRRGILAALRLAARTGVTSVQTDAPAEDFAVYTDLRREERLTLRVYGWVELTEEEIGRFKGLGEEAPFGDYWLRRGLLKAYADGTLGSRTAWMLEPYADDSRTRGIRRIPVPELEALVLAADRAGLQVAVHAIGDAANREVLDAFEKAARATDRRGARHRIEHAQVLAPSDIARFAELGVVASMQPTHATSDLRWAEDRIGPKRAAAGAYAWRKLLEAGARIAFGTDFAVEPLAPIEGLYSAVTRQSREAPFGPAGGWIPSEKLTLADAIRLYTTGSAYAEFQENDKGTLEVGKLADLVVWDRDLFKTPEAKLLDAKPVLTVVGGRVVFEAQ
ncbi:MAG: amidohydrolase [Deltaproteobacteria bacterium]|nr:MAG: amidohydrolase [Deltaproteobacteria bacterium]TMB32735.1 MAG: amidohydrolase [Deltaproteobacteria bacterium]TMB35200.1 MAG: amidohydrolase [Deltaproteobacteria bacterium]